MTKRNLDFLAFSLFAVGALALAWLAYSFGGMDFNVYYAAARVTLQGGNPYDFQQLAPQILHSAGRLNNPYYYAPWFTWSVIPFALFPYEIARVLWAALNFLLWILALVHLSKLVEYPPRGWTRWLTWLFATFVFAWSAWGAEQVGVLILFLLALILLAAQKENWTQVGILLALILFKPNITALPAALLALWILLRKRTWKHVAAMTAALALLLALQWSLDPKFYLPLFSPDKWQGLSYTLDSSGGLEIKRYATTLRDFLAEYGIGGAGLLFAYALILALGGAALFFGLRDFSLVEFAALAVLFNFAIIPYALFYDYPSLTLTLFCVQQLLLPRKWIRYAANALVAASLFIGGIIPYRYWMVVFLSAFLALGYSLRRKTTAASER